MRNLCCMLLLVTAAGVISGGAPPGLSQVPQAPPAKTRDTDRDQIFDAVWRSVRDEFHDAKLHGLDWNAVREEFRPAAVSAANDVAFAAVINRMLARLETSHTYYFTPQDPRYFQILGIFGSSPVFADQVRAIAEFRGQTEIAYDGIGIDTLETPDGIFVTGVFEGLPANEAGVLVGDELLGVDGAPFRAVESFAGKAGQELTLTIRRHRGGPPQDLRITPRSLVADHLFADAMANSMRVIEAQGHKLAYVHAWSYAGQQYQDLLTDALLSGKLAEAQGLILDLRDGWGGASPEYLNLFNNRLPVMTMTARDGTRTHFPTTWDKPVALIINGNVRSGKEVFTLGFKQWERGPVIGTRTAGAVVAGSPRFMPDHSILYLAVGDVHVDGRRLEGIGVEPTETVERPIPYAAGADPQRDAAIAALLNLLKAARPAR